MSQVTELGYIGISVSNAAAWKAYAAEVVGMEVVDEGEKDRFYLRMDNWHHRITVHTGGNDDLAYLGWRVPGPDEFEAMAEKLRAARVKFEICSAAEADERRVIGLMKMVDPGGNPTEIFYSPEVESYRAFHPGRPLHGRFVTANQGLGHCIIRQEDIPAAVNFYNLLGLKGAPEVKIKLPNGAVILPVFMHTHGRQHSVAFGLGPMQKRINHLMIEYTNLKDLGITHDIVRSRQIDVALQLGMHCNDEAFTFYCANPSKWLWEIGWGARGALDGQEHYTRDIFGHGMEAKGYGLDIDLG